MNEVDSRLDPLAMQFEQHGAITYSNVATINEAQVIGIGETHDDKMSIKNEHWIINSYMREGDIFLREALPYWIRLPYSMAKRENPHIPQGTRQYGWDTILKHAKATIAGWAYKKYWAKKYKIISALESAGNKDALDAFLVSHEEKEKDEAASKQFADVIIESRNKALIKQIKRMRKRYPKSRIFFEAGRLHLNEGLAEKIGVENKFMFIQTHKSEPNPST